MACKRCEASEEAKAKHMRTGPVDPSTRSELMDLRMTTAGREFHHHTFVVK